MNVNQMNGKGFGEGKTQHFFGGPRSFSIGAGCMTVTESHCKSTVSMRETSGVIFAATVTQRSLLLWRLNSFTGNEQSM